MTSVAEKKRRKRASRINLPGGDYVDQPAQTGRPRKTPEDPRKTALEARCRRSGIRDPQDAVDTLCGTDLGLCIRALTKGDERAQLSSAWAALSASHRNYRVLVIGQTGDPKGASIAMTPDAMQTDQSLRVDLRTHDEKVAAAKASWTAWEAKIKGLPFGLKWIMEGVTDGFMGEAILWKDQKPTEKGRLAVQALRLIAQ